MKVVMIVEGAYPYINGGVSSWVQQLMQSMPDVEFVVQTIGAYRGEEKVFKYKIPENVSAIQEVYLLDDDYLGKNTKRKVQLTRQEYEAFESLLFGVDTDWEVIMRFFTEKDVAINALLSGKDFLNMVKNYYNEHFERVVFSDFLWTMRSMYLPLFNILKSGIEKADVYHSASAGYAGLWGCLQRSMTGTPFLMTEHGIYTREREEEIIKAGWVSGIYKDLWINQFRKIGECCYNYADQVVCLFQDAKELQTEFGCDPAKSIVIPNGVNYKRFENVAPKEDDDSYINVGAILRVTPIKDVKTLISAFSLAKAKEPRLKLWIMGGLEEAPEYVNECMKLVEDLKVEDVVFTGIVQVTEYIGKMDFLMLTSISEGQPLSILEGYAAKKPYIATDVGNCRGLIEGELDDFGQAGYVVPVMGVTDIAEAILKLAESKEDRIKMGEAGYKRVKQEYSDKAVFEKYHNMYQRLAEQGRMK